MIMNVVTDATGLVIFMLYTQSAVSVNGHLAAVDKDNINGVIAPFNPSYRVYRNVEVPDEVISQKYMFDGTSFTLNPNWVEPIET